MYCHLFYGSQCRFIGLHFCHRQHGSNFKHSDVVGHSYQFWRDAQSTTTAITPFKVTNFNTNYGNPLCNFPLVHNNLYHFQDIGSIGRILLSTGGACVERTRSRWRQNLASRNKGHRSVMVQSSFRYVEPSRVWWTNWQMDRHYHSKWCASQCAAKKLHVGLNYGCF